MPVMGPMPGQKENVQGKREAGGGGGGQQSKVVQPGSVAGVKVLWNLECLMGLSQKGNMCTFQMKENGAQFWTVCQKVKKEL